MRNKLSSLFSDLDANSADKKIHWTDQSMRDDPFIVYGPSMHNFLKLNSRLVCLFLLLALLGMLQMVIFRSFGGVSDLKGFDPVANWSFGSIGFPKGICSKNLIDWSTPDEPITMNFQCQGRTQIDDVLSSGVISYSGSADYAGLVMAFGSCYYGDELITPSYFNLMNYFVDDMFN